MVRWRGARKRGTMTDQVLAKANELSRNINILRKRKEELEETYSLLHSEDALKREWNMKTSRNCYIIETQISPDSVELALKAEMERADKELENLEKEFTELH